MGSTGIKSEPVLSAMSSFSSYHSLNVLGGIGTREASEWPTGLIADVKLGCTTFFLQTRLCGTEVTVG